MKIAKRIHFTGKNLNDVFALPCVLLIMKLEQNGEEQPLLVLRRKMARSTNLVYVGDTLIEYTDGTWDIEK